MIVAIISAVVNYIGALPWAPDPDQHTSTVRHAVRQMRVREATLFGAPYRTRRVRGGRRRSGALESKPLGGRSYTLGLHTYGRVAAATRAYKAGLQDANSGGRS